MSMMDWTTELHSQIVTDLQNMEAVSKPLNEGIVSIDNICKSMKNVHVDPITDICSNFNQIREHIEHAEQYLKTSELMINKKLGNMDQHMEQLIKTQKQIEDQKKEKDMTVNKLIIEKKSAEEMLNISQSVLEQAINGLAAAEHALSNAEDMRDKGEDVSTAGKVLIAVPIFGLIAGALILNKGRHQLSDALEAINTAKQDQEKFKSDVEEKTKNMHECQSKITLTQNEIEKNKEALKMIDGLVVEVQNHLEKTENIQQMVRKAVTLLSILSGRVNVLEKQTKQSIYWHPVVNTVQEVMKAVIDIAENELLCGIGNPDLMNTLKKDFGELLALCNPPSTP